jgi:hypothetical protein
MIIYDSLVNESYQFTIKVAISPFATRKKKKKKRGENTTKKNPSKKKQKALKKIKNSKIPYR